MRPRRPSLPDAGSGPGQPFGLLGRVGPATPADPRSGGPRSERSAGPGHERSRLASAEAAASAHGPSRRPTAAASAPDAGCRRDRGRARGAPGSPGGSSAALGRAGADPRNGRCAAPPPGSSRKPRRRRGLRPGRALERNAGPRGMRLAASPAARDSAQGPPSHNVGTRSPFGAAAEMRHPTIPALPQTRHRGGPPDGPARCRSRPPSPCRNRRRPSGTSTPSLATVFAARATRRQPPCVTRARSRRPLCLRRWFARPRSVPWYLRPATRSCARSARCRQPGRQ